VIISDINNEYLTKDRKHLNRLQSRRRSKLIRIDYMNVSPEAKTIIDSQRNRGIDGTASAIINRIVLEWAGEKGLAYEKVR
jgi:hypothetical protein